MSKNRRQNIEWVKKYVEKHPNATVDIIARAANNAGHPLSRGIIAAARRDLVNRPAAIPGVGNHTVAVPVEAFVPRISPRALVETHTQSIEAEKAAAAYAAEKRDERVQEEVYAAEQEREEEQTPEKDTTGEMLSHGEDSQPFVPPDIRDRVAPPRFGTMEQRRAYLNDLILERPEISIRYALELVREKFGRGVDGAYVADTLAAARELLDAQSRRRSRQTAAPTKEAQPAVPATPPPTVAPADDGVRIVMWEPPAVGAIGPGLRRTAKSEVADIIQSLVDGGVDPKSITLWKPVPLSIRLNIDLGEE
jgi:hypothetical protein